LGWPNGRQKNLKGLVNVLDHAAGSGLDFRMTFVGTGPERRWLQKRIAAAIWKDRAEEKGFLRLQRYRPSWPNMTFLS